jgi:hypothetical protein
MKMPFVVALLLCCSVAFAQTEKIEAKEIKKGSELQKKLNTMLSVTDPTIYDKEGDVIDSVMAKSKVRTFEYTLGIGMPKGQTEYKRVLFKVDTARQTITDGFVRMRLRPASPKLWEKVTLDLSPLANRTDLDKLKGKAVILIFWISHTSKFYEPVNEVIADYIKNDKFVVFAITHHPYDVAIKAFKTDPILNARNVFDAPGIVDFYDTENKPVMIVTNAQHQITLAITDYPVLIPRTLNKLLKQL